MRTLQECWREYRDKVYPQSMTADQNQQLHQAFFAGSLVAIQEVKARLGLGFDGGRAALDKLDREAIEVCAAHSQARGQEKDGHARSETGAP